MITSKDNTKVKEIKKLKHKKYRNNKFIVEGTKMVKEAISEKADIDVIVYKSGITIDEELMQFNCLEVSGEIFKELTDVVTPQGVLAVINKNEKMDEIDKNSTYILALDGIQDPGNLGTIIRTADSANLKQVVVSKDTVDAYSPKVVRSTMGAIYRVNVITVDDLAKSINELKKHGFKVVTTELEGEDNFYQIDYAKKVVVIGNEANGISKEVRKTSDFKTRIPILGKTESLNASVAASLMIYEYVRQCNTNVKNVTKM